MMCPVMRRCTVSYDHAAILWHCSFLLKCRFSLPTCPVYPMILPQQDVTVLCSLMLIFSLLMPHVSDDHTVA